MAQLDGLRILVVEDDAMIGMLVEDILLDEGCLILGPFASFSAGMKAAETEEVDAAILDVNLAGTVSYPIADVLAARRIPFVLTSGYGDRAAPAEHPEWPVCSKPFTFETLIAALKALGCRGRQQNG